MHGGRLDTMSPSSRALATAALVSLSFVGVAGVTGVPTASAAPAAIAGPVKAPIGPTSNAIVTGAVATLDALAAGDLASYQAHLVELAAAVSFASGVDQNELATVWLATDGTRMSVLLSALSQVGVPYRKNSATPGGGFDCSGLVSWAWEQAGVSLPHQSKSIISEVPNIALEDLLPGDVIWYPGHVEMALGVGDSFVHAPSTGKTVEVKRTHRSGKRLKFGNPIG
jgi:peptidoglycan DL-endopeptidase CwlO